MADDFSAVMDEVEVAADDATVADAGDAGEAALPALEGKTEPKEGETAEGDGRTLPQWIRNLKANDPEGFKAAKAEFFGRRAFANEFPGGMDEVKSVKAYLAEHGGLEGAQQAFTDLQTKAQELDGISEKMANGDPSLIADFVANSPEGFAKIAPTVLQEWSKADFDGYNAQLSGIFASTIASSGIPLDLERADMHIELMRDAISAAGLEANPAIVRAFNGIFQQQGKFKDWANGFSSAAKAPLPGKQDQGQVSNAQRELDQLKDQTFSTDFRNKVDTFRAPVIADQLKAFIAKDPSNAERREMAMSQVRDKVIERMANDPDYQSKLNAFTKRKDTAGAMKLLESRERLAISEIAPKVGRIIYGSVDAAKPAVEVKPKPAVRTQTNVSSIPRKEDRFNAIWDA